MEAVIHAVLKKRTVKAAVFACVFSIVTMLLCLPVAFTEMTEFDIRETASGMRSGIDIAPLGNCQVTFSIFTHSKGCMEFAS